jgi:hypothetical protein
MKLTQFDFAILIIPFLPGMLMHILTLEKEITSVTKQNKCVPNLFHYDTFLGTDWDGGTMFFSNTPLTINSRMRTEVSVMYM